MTINYLVVSFQAQPSHCKISVSMTALRASDRHDREQHGTSFSKNNVSFGYESNSLTKQNYSPGCRLLARNHHEVNKTHYTVLY